ncbi:MAG TPA: type I restriction endonuclease subunit R [Pyrinomonadaceae bacterium]|nr:type I restriction endonuclease subunit R [Pyrinomonadaceae bacterium]
MANYISENDIEQACCEIIMNELGYDEHINLWRAPDDGNQLFGRPSAGEVVRLGTLRSSLEGLNPGAPAEVINAAVAELTQNRFHLTAFEANRTSTRLLREGFDVPVRNEQGEIINFRIRFVDFDRPANNHFCVVQQLTIRGKGVRRPDLLIYVNGLPLVFIELKNATEATRQAYDKNLTDYRRDIAQLFDYNLVAVLSNTLETKIGSMTADWEQFFNWEKISDEKETPLPDREVDLLQVMRALFRKETLVDLLENFVLFYADRAKIVGKNHQFLGVNNAFEAFRERAQREGKLGVFWHTQGSGKSFSMAFLVQKIRRKIPGNFKFVFVTDREDLEDQLHKTFVRSGLITDAVRARSAEDLQARIQNPSGFVFTLIQKFKSPARGAVYPALTQRDDIIVVVDEAHRSQYKDLGENMRRAMPRANFIAFTGTPLLDSSETTKEWFGDYVSRYDFADSVADGSTVPIYYQNRVPKVQLQNDTLNEEYSEILEDENLSEEQQERLTREFTSITTVITDNDRLEAIAEDIVNHFPERGYLGKGMVISIDKMTALKMHDKVRRRWEEKINNIRGEIFALPKGSPERTALEQKRKWMRETEMCVVVSYDADENEKFDAAGLNIRPHREMMNRTWGDEHETVEDRFRNPRDKFRLVFVCAKWLTGFDAPTVSTLYLDKPMQNHTLMQTIARANRVAPALDDKGDVAAEESSASYEKKSGVVIDYIGVFKRLEKALAKYSRPTGDREKYAAEDFDDLVDKLEASIVVGISFMNDRGLAIEDIIGSREVFKNLSQFKEFADALSKTEELKKEFSVYQTAITSFYEACKPDILTEELLRDSPYKGKFKRSKEVFEYLRKIISRRADEDGNYGAAQDKADVLIDESIVSAGYRIESLQEISLSEIDFEKLEQRFRASPYKNLSISDLVGFLRDRVQSLLAQNVTRVDLAQKLQDIINDYNLASSDVEAFFKALKEYAERLRDEEKRAAAGGLSAEELEIFDMLFVENLGDADTKKVKDAAQVLLQKLKAGETQRTILTADWYKHPQLRENVDELIGKILDQSLPEAYDESTFKKKWKSVYTHVFNVASRGKAYWQ